MTQIESTPPSNDEQRVPVGDRPAALGVGCGALGITAAVWAFWMVLPGIVLGIIAIGLGLRARRSGGGEGGSVAVALGIVSILLVPSVLMIVSSAEDWGRDCALNPSNPDC